MDEDFFIKRKGTTDLGKAYEDLVTTSLVQRLLTSNQISEFKLSSNDDKFGAFDDIVLEINDNMEKYAVQLKHGKDKPLTLGRLGAEEGDFSIKKYFESYQSIKNVCIPCQFLLFTNLVADISDDTEIPMKGEAFDIQISKCTPNFLFDISEKNGYCYKFQPIARDSAVADPERMDAYSEFFENFWLYTNQSNHSNLRKNLADELKKSFMCDDSNIDKFIKLISEWSKREGKKKKLNKSWMQKALTLCMLDSCIKPLSFNPVQCQDNEKRILFQKAISKFCITVFEQKSYDGVKRIWSNATKDFKDLEELNRLRIKYELSSDYITRIDQIDDLLASKLLWLMDKCPLIVIESKITEKVFQFYPTGKFILLKKTSDNLQKGFFQNISDLDTASDLFKDSQNNSRFLC